jgi:6,7-dimethyl-8-ribityllumazine synthase
VSGEQFLFLFYCLLLTAHCSLLVIRHRLFYTALAFNSQTDSESWQKTLQPVTHQGRLNAEGFRFAIISSRWNDFITARLVEGALDALERLGASESAVAHFRVPGSFEIPLLALRLAESEKYDAVICLGTVIRGQTPHFEYVAGEVTKGVAQAAMETGVPVVYGVVTADTLEQAIDRAGVKAGNKGFEAAMAAVELVNLYKEAFPSDED